MNILFPELHLFVHPLRAALTSTDNFTVFLAEFGVEIADPAVINNAWSQLSNIRTAIEGLQDTIETVFTVAGDIDNLKDLTQIDAATIAPIIADATAFYNNIDDVVDLVSGAVGASIQASLPEEILDYLIDSYLMVRLPAAHDFAKLIEVRTERFIETGDPDGRNLDFTLIDFEWARLRQFIFDNPAWADEVYGWGRDFDHLKALMAINQFVQGLGQRTVIGALSGPRRALFVPNAPAPTVVNGVSMGDNDLLELKLPIFEKRSDPDALGSVTALGSMGFLAAPVGNFNQPDDMGLAISPYVEGSVSAQEDITDWLVFEGEASASATGGAYVAIQPSGISIVGGASAAAAFETTFNAKKADDSKLILFGGPDSTRLQIQSAHLGVGGRIDTTSAGADLFAAVGVSALELIIDPGDDGLLSAVLSAPMSIDAGDLALGFRQGRGVYFEGGGNIGITIPVSLSLGPINIHEFGLHLELEDVIAVKVTTTADLTLGPLFAYGEGMGVKIALVEAPQGGLLGRHDLDFSFVPPTAYALELDASVITGGGLISITETEYRGALALRAASFGFSAFGILNTELPGGERGFSFAASIFGDVNVPLAFGFFLTGVGGMIGLNRTIDTDALREVLYAGRMDQMLFPADPIANAASILDDMAAVMPPMAGQHFFGPVVKIGWGQPTLIDVKLGVVIEVGASARLLILGGLSAVVPNKTVALVDLNLNFFGEIDFGAKTISFDASIVNSRILTFSLSGDAAIRTGWADRIEHIASFGGLHPQFPRPASLPDLRRITISFGTNNPRVTITAYTAVTSNSLQFGGRADAYVKGPKIWLIGQLAAEGWLYLDALIYFDPFAFDVSVGGGLNLLRDGKVAVGLGFDIRLRGPNTFQISGKAWITFMRKKIKIPVNATWGTAQSISTPSVNPGDILRDALLAAKGFEPVASTRRAGLVSFATSDSSDGAVDPLGMVRLSQRAMPLGLQIQKVGENRLSGGANRVDIAVRSGGTTLATEPAMASFVRGHFFQLSEAERLRATAFETHRAGFEVGQSGLSVDGSKAIETAFEHEFIEIPVDEGDVGTVIGQSAPSSSVLSRFASRTATTAREAYIRDYMADDAIAVRAPLYVPADVVGAVSDNIRDVYTASSNTSVGTAHDAVITGAAAEATFSEAQHGRPASTAENVVSFDHQAQAGPVEGYIVAAAGRF